MLSEAVAVAIEALSWIELEDLSERSALMRVARQLRTEDPNALRMAQRLVVETTRRQNTLDRLVAQALSPESADDFTIGVKSFLRLFAYWTKFRGGGKKSAIALANAARQTLGWKDLHPVEEAIGRILSARVSEVLTGLDERRRIAFQFSHPDWFVRSCYRVLGRTGALALFRRNLLQAPTYIRLNTLVDDETRIHRRLTGKGMELERDRILPYVYRVIRSPTPLVQSDSYRAGLFAIQDRASAAVLPSLDPKPRQTVLDVCAAPGVKTSHLAQLMGNTGVVCSIDRSKRRMDLWKREMNRMRVDVAMPVLADAARPLPFDIEADLILLDPPCSNTGVFMRTPSAKWRSSPRLIAALSDLQLRMLESCSRYLRPAGTLAYCTCSIMVEENELVVERFLRLRPEFRLVPTGLKVGVGGLRGLDLCRRLYPHMHDCNGYFIAKMEREL